MGVNASGVRVNNGVSNSRHRAQQRLEALGTPETTIQVVDSDPEVAVHGATMARRGEGRMSLS